MEGLEISYIFLRHLRWIQMSHQISTTAAYELQSWVLTDRKSPMSRPGWGEKNVSAITGN